MNYGDTARLNTLSVFNGVNPNGDWTLYFEDNGAMNTATLSSWSIGITAVPEPINVALGVFGGGALVVQGVRRWRGRARSRVPGLPPA